MTTNLHPVNFIILSGILQGIIIAGILLCSRTGNRYSNRLIGFFVLTCCVHFSWTLLIDTNWDVIFRPVLWFPYSYLLAAGPLLLFYTNTLTTPGFRITRKQAIHFLPVIFEFVIQIFFIEESIRNNTLVYQVSGFMIFRILELLATGASILVYGKQSLSLIKIHETWLAENFSNSKDITLGWLRSLIKYLRVLLIGWMAFELSFILFWQFQVHLIPVYLLLYLLLGIITYSIYWIGIQALIKSKSLTEYKASPPPIPAMSVYARLTQTDVNACVDQLHNLMKIEKLYLHDTLTLRTLATRLQKDPNLVSHILNNHFQKSFHDYVNEYRVNAVKEKIQDPKYAHLKIVEIAYDCGFNSKTTFNRVFKNLTGQSPSSYKANPNA